MVDDKHNFTHDGSPAYARKALQETLKNLGVDYIDLYILRSKDTKLPIEESVKAMAVCTVPFASVRTVWTVALTPAICCFDNFTLTCEISKKVTQHVRSQICFTSCCALVFCNHWQSLTP